MYNTFGNKWKTRLNSFLLIINKAGQEEDVDIKQENFFFSFLFLVCFLFVCLFGCAMMMKMELRGARKARERGRNARQHGTGQIRTARHSAANFSARLIFLFRFVSLF